MIPVALPSAELLLYLAFFVAATLFWFGWTISLVVRYIKGRWRRPLLLPYMLVTACALFTLWQSAVYVDGFVDSDRWVLDMPEGVPVRIDNFELADASIALDAERRLYKVRSAVLSSVATLAGRGAVMRRQALSASIRSMSGKTMRVPG